MMSARVPHLFCSYAGEDREEVRALLDGIRRMGCQLWVSERLTGGQAWWDEILAELRGCGAMLIAVSPALLDSNASAPQRQYARQVGKPLLPVLIKPVSAALLPPDLASLQMIDYTVPSTNAALELAEVLLWLPPAAPLPYPLPDPPPVPISDLANLWDRQQAAETLSLDEQLAVVARLRTAWERPKERDAALALLQELRQRPDLYSAPSREIARLLQDQIPDSAEQAPPTEPIAPSTEADTTAQVSDVPPDEIPDKPTAKIFLCYRREDTQWVARSIYESLSARYGEMQVFRDIDSTPAGVKYSTWIESRIGQCSVMLVVIGDAWSSAEDHAGRRRLDLPKDWVRQEIEAALSRQIPIIPVCVQGASMPSEDELPSSIADLTAFQSAEITDSRWDYDIGRLLKAIDDLVASGDDR
jgi:hypothetical protein